MHKPKNAIMDKIEVREGAANHSFSHRPPRPSCLDRPCYFLVGLPGSGKTDVGRALAEKLGVDFIDAAEETEKGESEMSVLQQAAERGGMVAAASSDAVLDPDVSAFMRANGKVLYLMASVPALLPRLKDRLPGGNPDSARKILADMLVEREPLFHEALHLLVQADNPFDEVVEDAFDKARL